MGIYTLAGERELWRRYSATICKYILHRFTHPVWDSDDRGHVNITPYYRLQTKRKERLVVLHVIARGAKQSIYYFDCHVVLDLGVTSQ